MTATSGPAPAAARLAGTAALVTGGSSGIGFGLARVLVEEGAAVTIVGRNGEKLAAAAAALRAAGGTVLEAKADLSTDDGVLGAVERHREEYGRLDVLVNNAGVCLASKAARQERSAIDAVLDTDLRAVVLLYQAGLDLLLEAAGERGKAHVLNLASLLGRYPAPWLAVYSATKAAVISFTQSMNRAYARRGLLSTAVCPGFVDTPMSEDAKDLSPDEMIPVDDIAELTRAILRLSPRTYVPEILLARSRSTDPSGL
ncbi:MAG TPA: SDR family oxidoreductase [Acidimicrobiia bacterium]|nr:SDR family oxidoreductase [Acidimicrobiia bacterium]